MERTMNYKGVSWNKKLRMWEAYIVHNKTRHKCGFFENEITAVKARDRRIIALGLPTKLLQIIKPLNKQL